MKAHVYKSGDKKFASAFGKVYRIEEDGKAVLLEDYNFFKFFIETFIGTLTLGKKGMLKTYKFIDIEKEDK